METPKPISRKAHSALDYIVPLGIFAVPRLLGWTGAPRMICDISAIGALAYTLFTDHEGGVWHKLPMRGHLTLDTVKGASLALAGAALTSEPTAVRATMAGMGLGELAVVAMTDPERP